jgi:hypothetical protein
MKTININIINIVGGSFCTEADDGQKVYEVILRALKEGRKVKISFLNVEMLTTAFLNTAIGQLYRDYTEEAIKERLSVESISASGAVSLKRVVETAKQYYKNPDAMKESINNILGE